MPFREGDPPQPKPEREASVDDIVDTLDELRRARDPFDSPCTADELRGKEEDLTAAIEAYVKAHPLTKEECDDLMAALRRFRFNADPMEIEVTHRLDAIYDELDNLLR